MRINLISLDLNPRVEFPFLNVRNIGVIHSLAVITRIYRNNAACAFDTERSSNDLICKTLSQRAMK